MQQARRQQIWVSECGRPRGGRRTADDFGQLGERWGQGHGDGDGGNAKWTTTTTMAANKRIAPTDLAEWPRGWKNGMENGGVEGGENGLLLNTSIQSLPLFFHSPRAKSLAPAVGGWRRNKQIESAAELCWGRESKNGLLPRGGLPRRRGRGTHVKTENNSEQGGLVDFPGISQLSLWSWTGKIVLRSGNGSTGIFGKRIFIIKVARSQ